MACKHTSWYNDSKVKIYNTSYVICSECKEIVSLNCTWSGYNADPNYKLNSIDQDMIRPKYNRVKKGLSPESLFSL